MKGRRSDRHKPLVVKHSAVSVSQPLLQGVLGGAEGERWRRAAETSAQVVSRLDAGIWAVFKSKCTLSS